MARKTNIYVVLNRQKKLIIEDHKLPIYWLKKEADKVALKFKAGVFPIDQSRLYEFLDKEINQEENNKQ